MHVDDEAGFLKVSKQILELNGPFQVDSASSVKEALREKGNKIPFILFTGKGREDVAIEALIIGADRYLNKIGKPETAYGELAHSIFQVVEKQKAKRLFEDSKERFRLYVENSLCCHRVYDCVQNRFIRIQL